MIVVVTAGAAYPMPVPTYDRFIEPILRYLAAHAEGSAARDVHDAAASALGLTESDRLERLPSGLQAVYKNRAGWAHDRLKRAGLSRSTTESGSSGGPSKETRTPLIMVSDM